MNKSSKLAAPVLSKMERNETKYPLATVDEALQLLDRGIVKEDALSVISKLTADEKLFVFKFDSQLRIPAFQFTQEQGIHASIPTLVKYFGHVSDSATYHWFTTYNEDLEAAPADCLAENDKFEKLIDLAGLFVNSTTFRSVSDAR
ncbi:MULTISPECIES: hypothetical protein [unclassified Agarivorans]|uniref:hypothetical protein n=1 Tax=unclassified Agarivorans TaxID=2636026 RepID=UPI0026E24864|nr:MULTISPECIES: hypothetical protein [unclassified Agarivorans]MDO6686641.1 hypothetical protein [Agarivorans sp. 3_MG-2023]MDO6717738.1 hypothetical protein [Agarivorans sp. 2_MG-2023]